VVTASAGSPLCLAAYLTISIILIDNIDFVRRGMHAEFMASHPSVKRRYVDLEFVSSAACPPGPEIRRPS
jgi:hypothetical protein